MSEQTLQIAKELLAEAAQREVDEVPDDATINDWEGWNSLAHMRLIMAMEEKLGKELGGDVIVEIGNLQDVANFLTA